MAQIKEIILTHTFDKNDLETYSIKQLPVALTMYSAQRYTVEQLTFMVTLADVEAAAYFDESDIEYYEEVLMYATSTAQQQQQSIDQQCGELPFEVFKEKHLQLNIPLYGEYCKDSNLLGIIMTACTQNEDLNTAPFIDLSIVAIANFETQQELQQQVTIKIDNPIYHVYKK